MGVGVVVPPGYDLPLARICAGAVVAATAMHARWVADGRPPPTEFVWKPDDLGEAGCGDVLWGSFGTGRAAAPVAEPVGIDATVGGVTLLAFRGTPTVADWVGFTFRPATWWGPGRVPHGFRMVYAGMRAAVRARLPAPDLVLTGHGLGAALATFAVFDAVAAGCRTVRNYTTASPNAGDAEFVAGYDRLGVPTYRLVNLADVVPMLPPHYRPVGRQASFEADYGSGAANHDPRCYAHALTRTS